MSAQKPSPERSFGPVADVYDRARPSYPDEAVSWMTGSGRSMVLELGAGTGKLTEVLHRAGHDVLATDPLPEMLALLAQRVDVPHVVATAEDIPVRSPGRRRRVRTVLPLVRPRGGDAGDRPRPAAGRCARTRLEHLRRGHPVGEAAQAADLLPTRKASRRR